jgi:predicted amidophosphoribosyltransferase
MIGQGGHAPASRPCPFCAGEASQTRCGTCGRDPTARRRVCPHCGKMTPSVEPACCHCRSAISSGRARTAILIIVIVVALNALGLIIRLAIG